MKTNFKILQQIKFNLKQDCLWLMQFTFFMPQLHGAFSFLFSQNYLIIKINENHVVTFGQITKMPYLLFLAPK